MKINQINEIKFCEMLIYGVFENGKVCDIDLEKRKFNVKYCEFLPVSSSKGKLTYLIGLGKKEELTMDRIRRLFGKCISLAKKFKQVSFSIDILEIIRREKVFDDKTLSLCAVEGIELADYKFCKYITKNKQKKNIEEVNILFKGDKKYFVDSLKIGKIIANATNFTRDLVNEPANFMNSLQLEKIAKILAQNKKIRLKVLNKENMQKLGMGALLGVSKGSSCPPKMIILHYDGGKKENKPIAIVGKGITFDSGGYNLKPTGYMEDMKIDMSGGAAVLGIIKAISELNIKQNVVGIVPACENMVSANAQRPGDIVKAFNGKTIEIGNTDAEGRLILADALAYCEKVYKPELIIDIATLTGACMIALGQYAGGMMGKNSDKIQDDLQKFGIESGDRVWKLPFFEEYQGLMKGTISDLNNISSKRDAGAITAGVFLSKFVENTPWIHLDIAGPASITESTEYLNKGGTGAGVRLLTYYLLRE